MDIIFQLLAGWFVADFVGGLFHLYIDHHAAPGNPVFGSIVRDFREHHDNRLSMEKYSRLQSFVLSGISGVPFLIAWWLSLLPAAFAWTVFAGLCLTQHAHKYAHSPNPPVWARLLQQLGLFISPEAHERHHSDFNRSYGVFNGWSHGTLDLLLGRRYT